MNPIIEKLLSEVDADLREFLLADSYKAEKTHLENEGPYTKIVVDRYRKNWELLSFHDILAWQEMRDRRKKSPLNIENEIEILNDKIECLKDHEHLRDGQVIYPYGKEEK